MPTVLDKNADVLQKAKAKSLASHFKKAAAHHDAMADTHEKCMKAHEAHQEHHESMMGKAEDAGHAHHKASASFHKTMAGHHEKLHKRHAAHADHHRAMAEAHSNDGEAAAKALQSLGIEEEIPVMSKTDPIPNTSTQTTAAATNPTTATATNPTLPENFDFNNVLKSALDTKLTEGINAALERVLNSEDFNKKVDNQIAGMLLEKLGTSSVATEVKTFPVPRTGSGTTTFTPIANKSAGAVQGPINTDGVDLELLDLCKIE